MDRVEVPRSSRDIRFLHVFGIAVVCAGIGLGAKKRLNKVASARLWNGLLGVVGLTFGVFCYHSIADAAEAGALRWKLFFQLFLAGGMCAFLTHAACTPIDVVKTRLQTQSQKYSGALDAIRSIVKDEGPQTLLKGLGATATGYFLHGAFKYSFYEVFKVILAESPEVAKTKPPLCVAALGGFLAECVACILLCPMEAIRIRSVSDPTFPSSVAGGLQLLLKSEGMNGLYKGLPSLLLRQVPYTVGQFVSFEFTLVLVKLLVEPLVGGADGKTESITGTGAMVISLSAGLLAGAMASVVSQPGDTILSKINQEESEEQSAFANIKNIVLKLGISGLFLGLGTRLVQVSFMIGGQFLIYDSIKLMCGIQPASAVPSTVANAIAKGTVVGGGD